VAEWNYEKNGNFKPENFTSNSNKKVWWKCNRGHEWQATISDRNSGKGCPYCSGRYAIRGYNDLQTVNPTLAKEWNYEKNNELTPMDISSNSSKKVWWKCSKGHEWQATIVNRNRGSGCPYCSGRYAIKGENDLQTVNPFLTKEWNYRKNGNLRPESFTASSGQKVWWKCSKGHEWQARIADRNNGNGCPVCSKEKRKRRN
ncbi:MAG: zinc-ribbon domain-containing protein, partial [Firmicutes bacterium]|nr:zinc-ribbon domain-containing protein [Bacillota bacterium]